MNRQGQHPARHGNKAEVVVHQITPESRMKPRSDGGSDRHGVSLYKPLSQTVEFSGCVGTCLGTVVTIASFERTRLTRGFGSRLAPSSGTQNGAESATRQVRAEPR